MVAAAIFSRHGPASRSAARRNTAARSSNGSGRPVGLGGHRGLDRGGGLGVPGVGQRAQHRAVVVRLNDVDALAAAHHVLAADDVRQVDRVGGEGRESLGEAGAFGGMRGVFVNRLVGRQGHVGDGVHADKDRRHGAANCWLIRQHCRIVLVESDNMATTGVGLGQLLLALDATMVSLVEAPRGLDLPVASAALIDSDDVRLGLAVAAGSADVFFLLGISDADALRWIDRQVATRAPTAIFVKEPADAVVARAVAAGTAVVAVEPQARWERLYRIGQPRLRTPRRPRRPAVRLEHRPVRPGAVDRRPHPRHGQHRGRGSRTCWPIRRPTTKPTSCAGCRSWAAPGRREHLQWIGQWGIFDALRARPEVVRVDERPELGLRPRLAIGIHQPTADRRRAPAFAGTIWVQQGSRPLADDAEEVLRGAAVLAARIMARLAATPSTHAVRVQQLLGLSDSAAGTAATGRDRPRTRHRRRRAGGADRLSRASPPHPRLADVLALSASAFHRDAQVAANGPRVYVLFPVDRQARRGDLLGARRRRRAAHRAGPGVAGGDRRPGGRARSGRVGARRGGPRARQRRPPPRRAAAR